MIFITYSIILLLLFSGSTTCDNDQESERIMNGGEAELEQFPYMVSIQLRYRNLHFCGGTLITNQHVLSAAHCFYVTRQLIRRIPASLIQVRAGLVDLASPESFRNKRFVRQVFIHEEFSNNSIINDIAILVLFSPRFQLSSYLETAVLSFEFIDHESVIDQFCYIVGWGRQCGMYIKQSIYQIYPIQEDEDASEGMNETLLYKVLHSITGEDDNACEYSKTNLLQYATITLENIMECEKDYWIEVPEQILCAGTRGSKADACKGDSGGPLICDGVLEGIISFGDGCNNHNFLGGYTRVFSHLEWIADKINQSSITISKLSSIFYILCILILLKID